MSQDEFIPASETYDPATGQTQQRLGDHGDVDLGRLSRKERRAYVACRINGASIEDHAAAVGLDRDVVAVLIERAEQKLGER